MIAYIRDKNYNLIKKIEDPDKSWILEQLEKNICLVLFRKKTSGIFRSLKCTRNLDKFPKKFKIKYKEFIENPHGYDNIVPVWELSTREWKSFYYSSIYSFTVLLGES